MNLEAYIRKLEQFNPDNDLSMIIKAYNFGENAHRGQFRKSGESYFIHPVNVSLILAELEMDEATIIAGLLHDVIEDTDYTYEDISNEFSEEVAILVDGVTKLGKIHYETKEEREAENLRKMLLAMARDIRVVLIKLADRLHNMRTLKYMTDEKKKEKAMETLEIYAPIAHRLGISKIKWELEDLGLLYTDPDGYYDLVSKVDKKRSEREKYINKVIDILQTDIKKSNIKAEIYGRPKNFYSIYKKMVYQHKNFDQIYDITAVRILVDSVKDCYGVLGIVHTIWKPIPGRFKDYIAMPKPNMYQSLHTTVISEGGDPLEIQIRTYEMHRIAEFGIAAHWKYKEGQANDENTNLDDKLGWLRQMMEIQGDLKDPKEFMDSLKLDLFNNQVFVFTPKGKVIELPVGSTPIDFAYKIHSAVGNNCIGAKVDGRIVPLNFKLKNGMIVDIITSKNSNGPSRDWLKFVMSTQAKNKIRHWFKKERREENIEKGRDMLEKEIRRSGFQIKELMKNEWLQPILKSLSTPQLDDLYAAIGYGGILTSQVIPRLREKHRSEQKKLHEEKMEKEEFEHRIPRSVEKEVRKKSSNTGVEVKGADGMVVRFAKCCSPVPGDAIIGYITRGRGITVHRRDCPNFQSIDDSENRFIEVSWLDDEESSYSTEIQIIAPDRKGLLSEITTLITETKLLVTGINAKLTKNEVAIINLTIEINDIQQLSKVIAKIKNIPEVIDVKRIVS
ncbi:MAG: bifunctional (p)ppGpp synthetase/guanosine-3',5'-bis(diphosphate) 3'-pyrophosphohydrolase [Firmicutes bacterium]|jgi:GTP pyrophosphokinase|nr:bifunctional (p)ppGpp synthetase/guanosine-3',5'-bis(diphosphate) 3'-pyrophosphohydrolase [Bacillota bacterium]